MYFTNSFFPKSVFIEDRSLDTLYMDFSIFQGQVIVTSFNSPQLVREYSFANTTFRKGSSLYINPMPNKLRFNNVTIEDKLDLTRDIPDMTDGQTVSIDLRATDISKLKLPAKFDILIDNDHHDVYYEEYCSMYENILTYYSDRGHRGRHRDIDIEYQRFKDRSTYKWRSKLVEWWWNFGYDSTLIFYHILQFLIGFTIISYWCLKELQTNIYTINSISEVPNINRTMGTHSLKRLWYAFAYSAIVFLLLSIKIEKLQLKAQPWYIVGTIFLLLMHITGLFCIGFLVKFVLHM
ncbi:hypothetical protein SAMN04488121_102414 [Chitinophaga filiformis]|uniref:Uncharacterized protein n=1 Tax=Chitinophaga filiformis TaxID=104663 RepID=A0A1G7MGA9_CHIFI|nr:hypothetical protein SAMN04488121_102414 [Chitinophaga filiformis]